MSKNLGDRMKGYEAVTKNSLMPKTPAIIRLDGKAFHTWTKGLEAPFDNRFYACMASTARQLTNEIQGAAFAYGQSDEISILLRDYDTYDTEAWFNGAIQKIVSVSASMATGYFNRMVQKVIDDPNRPLAFFDARVFNVPAHEVCNYFIWRQQDFMRNSLQMVARHYLGHKRCHGLNREGMKRALMEMDEPVVWDELPTLFRHGYSYTRGAEDISTNIPQFTSVREYIDIHVAPQQNGDSNDDRS